MGSQDAWEALMAPKCIAGIMVGPRYMGMGAEAMCSRVHGADPDAMLALYTLDFTSCEFRFVC